MAWPQCPSPFASASGYLANAPALAAPAQAAGHITPRLDSDGVVRRQPAIVCHEGKAYPALVDSVVRVRVCQDGGPQLVGRMLPARIVRATPSPARDAVDIELNLGDAGTSAGTIDVMSADGRRVMTRAVKHDTKHLRLELTGLSAGIYSVVLTTPTTSDHITMIVVP